MLGAEMRAPPSDAGPFQQRRPVPTQIEATRKVWALCERFRSALEDFIHSRQYDRAFSWENELAGFLQSWKARGIILSESQHARLRALLIEMRNRLVPADQLRAQREEAIKIAALHRTQRPIELGEPKSVAEAANSIGLRKFGHDLMSRNPPEKWLACVSEWFQKLRLTDEMKSEFWAWIAAEQAEALKAGGRTAAPPGPALPAPSPTAAPPSTDKPDWVNDLRTELLWRLGETNVKRFPVEFWLTAAKNILKFISATEEVSRQFLQWIAGEQDLRRRGILFANEANNHGSGDASPGSAGPFSDPDYGTRDWFVYLVRTRENYQFREGFRVGMPEKTIRENYDKVVRQNSVGMFDAAWKLANELLDTKKVEDKDTAIRIAAIATYRKFYPPDQRGDVRPGPETAAEIAYWDQKARQILAGQGPLSRLFEGLLLPTSVNPDAWSLENLIAVAGGVAGTAGKGGGSISGPRIGKPGPRGGSLPNKTPGGKIGGAKKPRPGGKPQPGPAPPKKPIEKSREKHGNVTHDATAYNIGKAWEADEATIEVRFNQDLVDTHGNRIPGLRPDVQRIRKAEDGRLVVDVMEIRSPDQTRAQMNAKKEKYRALLEGQAGVIDWKDPDERKELRSLNDAMCGVRRIVRWT